MSPVDVTVASAVKSRRSMPGASLPTVVMSALETTVALPLITEIPAAK